MGTHRVRELSLSGAKQVLEVEPELDLYQLGPVEELRVAAAR